MTNDHRLLLLSLTDYKCVEYVSEDILWPPQYGHIMTILLPLQYGHIRAAIKWPRENLCGSRPEE